MTDKTTFDVGRNADGPITYRRDGGERPREDEERRKRLDDHVKVLEGTKLARRKGLTSAERVLLERLRGFQREDEANDARREREREQREATEQAMQDMESRRRW